MKEILKKYRHIIPGYKERYNSYLELLEKINASDELKEVMISNEFELRNRTRELFLERTFKGRIWEWEVRGFVRDLTTELKKRYNFKYFEHWGPVPISAMGSVVLSHESFREENNGVLNFIPEKALRLNVVPVVGVDGVFTFKYITLNKVVKYEKGTVGYMNMLNSILAPLPDTFEEVLQIMKEQYKEKYGRDYEKERVESE